MDMNVIKEYASGLLCAVVGAGVGLLIFCVYHLLIMALDMPDVYTSYSTDKCVKIEYKGQVLPCSQLKEFNRYDNHWVE